MRRVLVDTGVWYARFDRADHPNDRESIDRLSDRIDAMEVIVPWPVAYETLRTKFVRNRLALERFEQRLKKPNVVFVDDALYREDAFTLSVNSSLHRRRPLSMVDCVLRLLLSDTQTKIDFLATYNTGDFIDVCRPRKIELLDG